MSTATLALVRLTLVAAVALAPACSSQTHPDLRQPEGLVVPDGCQPLLVELGAGVPSNAQCVAPFPSDFHRVADPSSPTGWRVGLRGAARPRTGKLPGIDVHDLIPTDGASLVSSIVGGLLGDVLADGLPGVLDDPTLSARPESATLLVRVDTGELVAHYADVFDRKDATHSPIVLRPFAPLVPRTRYVAAIRGARVPAPDGGSALAPAAGGFRLLRDGSTAGAPAQASLAAHFDDEVFPVLARAGVAREGLQLAWDFTTGSEEQPMADMLAVRDLTLAWAASHEPTVRVTSTAPQRGALATIVNLEISAPLFLDDAGPGGHLHRDGSGAVAQNGTTTFPMVVVVPTSVASGTTPGRALAYGHGFFGSFRELTEGDGARTIASALGAVLFGLEWWGMSEHDAYLVADALSAHPDHVADFAERVHQAMANWLVATRAIRGALTHVPELHRPPPNQAQLLYDPSFVGYFGASQGHILGGTLAALEPAFTRVVLDVGGGALTHIMPRSSAFGPFGLLVAAAFPDPLLAQSFLATLQRPLDRIDATTYARRVLADPLPGSAPDRRVLMQIGLGDAEVPNMGSFIHARALGIGQLMPAPMKVFGLSPVDASAPSSMTLFDFGVDRNVYASPHPADKNVVHEGVRVDPRALAQMKAFLRPGGEIVNACGGPCNP